MDSGQVSSSLTRCHGHDDTSRLLVSLVVVVVGVDVVTVTVYVVLLVLILLNVVRINSEVEKFYLQRIVDNVYIVARWW